MNDTNKSICDRLRIIRLANKLTQEEIAREFFISRSCWANYERGTRSPNFDLLIQISRKFNVEIGYLIGGKFPPAPTKEIADFKLLSKDWKLDISELSVLHKMIVVEICRSFLSSEEKDNGLDNCKI